METAEFRRKRSHDLNPSGNATREQAMILTLRSYEAFATPRQGEDVEDESKDGEFEDD